MTCDSRWDWLAEDYVRHYWSRVGASVRVGALALAGGALPTWQIATAAGAAGQPLPYAAGTTTAAVILATVAGAEVHTRRSAGGRGLLPAAAFLLPLALAAACALVAVGPASPPQWWNSLLAVWPAAALAGAAACRLTRPAPRLTAAEPPPSHAEPAPEPPAQTDEPDAEPQVTGTKTARLLTLAAKIPDDDPRTTSARATDLAAQIGMHPATARRILASANRPTPAGSTPAQALSA
ncbi:hypothetical protein [Parafrankia sp. EUN1f]|uniref:hypothetical protein n=1 Tax=Parafrankia sp. EUN1f TaxID=102897 RepID=UPI0001C4524A|nr:hypothetical protein [Parafrankia sp. EUN1f]EFC79175.1 hypothetical protein FrEUN1fDRAFT_7706 [Parafrankia sp. EUN1f]